MLLAKFANIRCTRKISVLQYSLMSRLTEPHTTLECQDTGPQEFIHYTVNVQLMLVASQLPVHNSVNTSFASFTCHTRHPCQ